MTDNRPWVMDTTAFVHLCQAGHSDVIKELAPGGVVVVPRDVDIEIERGRDRYRGAPSASAASWARVVVLTGDEVWTQLQVKAHMGGAPEEHLGECAVIACAHHRNMVAILDERAAIEQADQFSVPSHDTLWIVVEAYKELFGRDRARTARVVDDLLDTGMYLPAGLTGAGLVAWAYQEGLLP